ncbi:MAG: SAM-dependent chlorinase/fluorinase [Deltaproteobacteria bacterium]|nr:SAM-dependent chlorinase/fluorinase [Deltaproteobacteria bacterium]
MPPIITLLTDFGERDGYVAQMKGVILSICPSAVLVDITHEIAAQDVEGGAYVLAQTVGRFPAGTIHVGVVDPGVGTARRGMAMTSGGQFFVGPDNGLFSFAWADEARAFEIVPDASASPHLSRPRSLRTRRRAPRRRRTAESFGTEFRNPVLLETWAKTLVGDLATGRVLHTDRFGNVITNFRPEDFGGAPPSFALPTRSVPDDLPVVRTFGDVPAGKACWMIGSGGYFELAVNGGSAAARFAVERGDPVHARRR